MAYTRNSSGGIYGFVGLFPIKPETDCAQFRNYLRDLDGDPNGSTFSAISNIHMVRLAIIDGMPFEGEPASADSLASRYLLFVCDFDGASVDDLAATLAGQAPNLITDVWGGCWGCPDMSATSGGAESVAAYFRRCQFDINYFLSLQIDESVPDILRALQLKKSFSTFMVKNQHRDPAALQSDFLTFWKNFCKIPSPHPGSI